MSSKGALSNPAKFGEAQRMLYLQAVIKEGIRVYPATGFPLWRTVPEPGVTLWKVFPTRCKQCQCIECAVVHRLQADTFAEPRRLWA